MALTLDWNTKVITVPKSELTLVTGTRYTITVEYWWQLLREANYDAIGVVFDTMYNSIAPTTSTPRIVEVINGYTAQFEDGLYSVEFINGNTNFRDIEIKNLVSVGTNNTTGFIDPTFLEAGIFNGHVYIDIINGVAGTDKTPNGGIIGTHQTPSNNFADTKSIADNRGLVDIVVAVSTAITTIDFSAGYNFIGVSPFVELTCAVSSDLTNCSFNNLTVIGELDGVNVIRECTIGAVTNVSGFIEKCALQSTITLNGATFLMECYSQVTGDGHPIISPFGHNLGLRDCHGSFGFADITGGLHSVQTSGGKFHIYNTCIGGQIHLRGVPFEVVDASGVGCVVVDQTDSEKVTEIHTMVEFIKGIEGGKWLLDNNQMIFYADDNTTELARFNMFDELGAPTTTGDIFKRERV